MKKIFRSYLESGWLPFVICAILFGSFPLLLLALTALFYVGLMIDPAIDRHLGAILPAADGPAYAALILVFYGGLAVLITLVPAIYQFRRKMRLKGTINLGIAMAIVIFFSFPYCLILLDRDKPVLSVGIQEERWIAQLNGKGMPNPFTALVTRNYDERRVIEAAQVLGVGGVSSERAVRALIEALNTHHNVDSGDGIIPVRSEIALALGRIGDPAAIEPLIAILDSDDPVTPSPTASLPSGYKFAERTSHGDVAEALGMFGARANAAVPHILPLLKYSGEDYYTRNASVKAVKALGQIKASESIPYIIEALNSVVTRMDAAEALGNYGPQAREALPTLRELLAKKTSYLKSSETWAIETTIKKIDQ